MVIPKLKRKRIKVHIVHDDDSFKVRISGWIYQEPMSGLTLAAHHNIYLDDDGMPVVSNTWNVSEPKSGLYVITNVPTRTEAIKQAGERIQSRINNDGNTNAIMDAVFRASAQTSDAEVRYEFE